MSTQNHSPPQTFQELSPKSKVIFLSNSPKELIQFLHERVLKLLHGNLQEFKKTSGKISKTKLRFFTGENNLKKNAGFSNPKKTPPDTINLPFCL